MEKREFKDNIFNEIARITKAISNNHRLEIIDLLSNGEKSVDQIATQTGNSIANASQHLQVLKKERLVSARREGVQIYYHLSSNEVYFAWKSLRDLSLSISPHVNSILTDYKSLNKFPSSISTDTLYNSDETVIIDVRPTDEYQLNHLKGAISIPIEELEHKYAMLPLNKTIVAYCRGMFCEFADRAVLLLREKGYKAEKIDENILELQDL